MKSVLEYKNRKKRKKYTNQSSVPRPTQPFIPLGSANEYQFRLERQRQVWFIPLVDEHGVCR